ncbi:hypothetical protein [Streptomyces sp. R21]|uniref:hypothetical protein n=1 Tax=Streptomyces sp. R21 TaxID=3238627 RepID=UPI0034DF832A
MTTPHEEHPLLRAVTAAGDAALVATTKGQELAEAIRCERRGALWRLHALERL